MVELYSIYRQLEPAMGMIGIIIDKAGINNHDNECRYACTNKIPLVFLDS